MAYEIKQSEAGTLIVCFDGVPVAWLVDGALQFDDANIFYATGVDSNPHPAALEALGLDATTIQAIHDTGNAYAT